MNPVVLVQGFIAGSLLCAGVGGHALRLVTLRGALFAPENRGRVFIAVSAIVIYGLATVLVLLGLTAGYWLALIFPFVGVSAVLLLGKRAHIDLFQVVLGVFQFLAAGLSAWMLFH